MSLALIFGVGVKTYITEQQLLAYGLRVAMRGRRKLRFLIFQLQDYPYDQRLPTRLQLVKVSLSPKCCSQRTKLYYWDIYGTIMEATESNMSKVI